jgi:hypothetical protein
MGLPARPLAFVLNVLLVGIEKAFLPLMPMFAMETGELLKGNLRAKKSSS